MSDDNDKLSESALQILDHCIRSGPQHVDMICFDGRLLELQRAGAILLARIGGEWHAYHTAEGFRLWDERLKKRSLEMTTPNSTISGVTVA